MKIIEWIAICAFIVSVFLLFLKYIIYLNAQADIRLNAEVNQILDLNHSNDSFIDKISPLDPNKQYCQLRITNVGGKSVVIEEIGIEENNGEKSGFPFSRLPTLPISLKPSEFKIYYSSKELILAKDKKIYLKSSKGKKWLFKISKLTKNH